MSDLLKPSVLVVDIDGTLVDSNYQHVIAWQRAFAANGVDAQGWIIHRFIGKGGDKMVTSVAGQQTEDESGDKIREDESEIFKDLIGEVSPLPGATEFVRRSRENGYGVVLSSSAKEKEVEHYVELLGIGDLIDGFTSSADADQTKPHPDLVESALRIGPDGDALMIGDSIWDVEAADRAGLECLAVLTGGFSKAELLASGAREVKPALSDLSVP